MKMWLLLPNLLNAGMRSKKRFVFLSGVEGRQNNWRVRSLILFFIFFNFTSFAQLKVAMKHVEKLTSPEMHGRGYVNGGDSIAAEYIARQYKMLGLKPVGDSYFQEFNFKVNTFPDSMRVTINGKNLKPGIDFIVDPYSGKASGIYDIVYCSSSDVIKKIEKLREENAKNVVLVIDFTGTINPDSIKKIDEYLRYPMWFPVIKLVDEKFTWSVAEYGYYNPMLEVKKEAFDFNAKTISMSIRNEVKWHHKSRNVIGYVRGGSKKLNPIVITAHYDHLGRMGSETYFPGCNDNASGVAMLFELANYYNGHTPKQDIYFIAFAGEEAGLKGSRYFISHPVFPLEKIRFLINMDIMGTGGEGITVVNATKHEKEFELLKKINDENDYIVAVKPRGEAANSDHYWFSQKGVPAFFIYTLGGSKAYHDVNDKFGSPDFSEFEDISTMLKEFVKRLN